MVDRTGYTRPREKGTTNSAWTEGGWAALVRVTVEAMLDKAKSNEQDTGGVRRQAVYCVEPGRQPSLCTGNRSCGWTAL